MKKVFSFIKRCRFILFFLAVFIIADTILGIYFDKYITNNCNFTLNDYEITRRDHPEKIWNKVFYGNSSVISAYREELSNSGYINFGADYASMTSLLKILHSDKVKIGSDLVVGINWAAMFDNMETNPNYFWNRKFFEPYSYFQRDKLYTCLTGKITFMINGKPWAGGDYRTQTKSYYFASLSDKELAEKVKIYEERYWSTGVKGCSDNLSALKKAADYCRRHNIRMRVVLMPWNPSVDKNTVTDELNDKITEICKNKNIDVLDLTDKFNQECFYDLGHLNYEYGSYKFMEVIDTWLNS